jgi:hypothetical protein
MDSGLHSRGEPSLFPLVGERAERGKGFFFVVPNAFPLVCSHQVPKVFLKIFHNSTTLLSHMVC